MSLILGGTPTGPVSGGGPIAALVQFAGNGLKKLSGDLLGVTCGTVVSSRSVASMTQVELDSAPGIQVPARSLSTRWPRGARVWMLALSPRTYLILGSASDATGRPPFIRPYTTPGAQDYVPLTDGVVLALLVETMGGGGAGGTTAATGVGQTAAAGGGQGGLYARGLITGAAIPTVTVVNAVGVAAGGASNPASAGAGGVGGFSFFAGVVSPGGEGGLGGTAIADTTFSAVAGGDAAPVGAAGSVQVKGSDGGMGLRMNTQFAKGGFGGGSFMAGQKRVSTGATSNGFTGNLYGGGGGGAHAAASQAIQAGGAGGQGGVWITYFFA